MYHYKVIERYSLAFRKPSYGIRAEVEENGIRACVKQIPDISCDKDLVDKLALRCAAGQLSPIHLLDVVLDTLP